MTEASLTLSLRLPSETRARLDRAATRTRRSRSFLVQEALSRYLAEIEHESAPAPDSALSKLLAMRGAGQRGVGLTAQEIDRDMRRQRDDD